MTNIRIISRFKKLNVIWIFIKNNKIITVKLLSNQNAIIGGLLFAKQAFALIDNKIRFIIKKKDGSKVKKGSITGIIGPNGCGKTTLFNSIVGYHPIDNGSIIFDDNEISKLLVGDIARLGMLRTFQQTRIYSKMNCVDNMQISVSHRKDSKDSMFASRKGEIKERAENLLEFVGLYSKRNLISGDLSFGQQ